MAIINALTLPKGHRIEADVCVIGSGAAGLAIATALMNTPLQVVVLESGGLEPIPVVQSLYEGRIIGRPDSPLESTRLRYFGGSTNHWTAHVRPLAPLDFEPRSWVPHSGWPFRYAELAPYYERTRKFLDLPERAFDVDAWEGDYARPWRFEGNRVTTELYQVVPPAKRRLGPIHASSLEASRNVDVLLNATVLEIVPEKSLRRVSHLRVTAAAVKPMTVRARAYVLATGGIENARLLLLSSSVVPAGVGNQNDLVGRFYANHLGPGRCARVQLAPNVLPEFYLHRRVEDGGILSGVLALSDQLQRRHELLRMRLQGIPASTRKAAASSPADLDEAIGDVTAELEESGQPAPPGQPRSLDLKGFLESVPNPASRVYLADERDALGQRRVVLDWRFGERESLTVHKTLEFLGRELGASSLGRLRVLFPRDGFASRDARGSFHHMGTTRMHDDPMQGVVDANGRVHGLADLYVAGSSVFPNYGTANPTYTILALAFRLADHLKELLARASEPAPPG